VVPTRKKLSKEKFQGFRGNYDYHSRLRKGSKSPPYYGLVISRGSGRVIKALPLAQLDHQSSGQEYGTVHDYHRLKICQQFGMIYGSGTHHVARCSLLLPMFHAGVLDTSRAHSFPWAVEF